MRIAITSDIHFFPQWQQNIHHFARVLSSFEPDLLIVAGDTGEPLELFAQGLQTLAPICKQRAALAGNHDVWRREKGYVYSSERLWEAELARVARANGYLWLEQDNLVVGGVGICGTIGWYDYGGKPDQLPFDDDFYEVIKLQVTNDARYIDWRWSDREFAARVGDAFQARLDRLEADPSVYEVLVTTHVPLYAGALRPSATPEQALLNAYYANVGLGEKVLTRPKVRAVVSGHVHHERRLSIPRANGKPLTPLRVFTVPADYGFPAALLLDTETWDARAVRSDGTAILAQ